MQTSQALQERIFKGEEIIQEALPSRDRENVLIDIAVGGLRQRRDWRGYTLVKLSMSVWLTHFFRRLWKRLVLCYQMARTL